MADPLPPTPFAEKLAAELRALHDRRERGTLSASDEARYAELWAWWQSGGGSAAAFEQPRSDELEEVPEEWVEALTEGQRAAGADASLPFATPGAVDSGRSDDDDLLREWQAWESRRPAAADPFSAMPGLDDAPVAPTDAEVLAARAEALGDAGPGAAPLGDGAADLEPLFPEAEPSPPPSVSSAPAEAVPAPAPQARRVVVHLVDGQVRRGTAGGLDLGADRITITAASGAPEVIARDGVRTVFFLRAPGEPPPEPAGQRVVVTFRDGRVLAGTSIDHEHLSDSFTLVPSDARTNAGLVWIARHAVRDVVAS